MLILDHPVAVLVAVAVVVVVTANVVVSYSSSLTNYVTEAVYVETKRDIRIVQFQNHHS